MVNNQTNLLDAVFSALAHPARRHMVERLATGAASVGELGEPLKVSAPAVSRHVRVLEDAGLVVRERDGRLHRMDMAGGALAEALHWLDRNHRFWSTRLDRLAVLLENPAPPPPAATEDPAWPRSPAPASRSRSSVRSPRRPSRSSTRSRKPRR
jgi:DNA-binding transcriptional ArsR family regulator